MLPLYIRLNPARLLLLLAASALIPSASADILWNNPLPTTNLNSGAGASRSNVAGQYGTLCDPSTGNCDPTNPPVTGTNNPYILGDQFVLSGTSNTITDVTVYEVGNTPTSGSIDDPTDEFSAITLYIGADQTPLSLISSTYTFQQVQYNGTTDYESVNVNGTFYPIFAITFSGLNLTEGPGEYDFAIGATPISSNVFSLLMSDPSLSGPTEDSSSLSPNNGFLFFFDDGGGPVAEYQYAPGSISNYPNGADADVLIDGTSTPEPSTFAMLGMGLIGTWAGLRRRAQAKKTSRS